MWHVTVLSQWSPGEGTGLASSQCPQGHHIYVLGRGRALGSVAPGWGGRARGVVMEERAQVTRSKEHGGEVT